MATSPHSMRARHCSPSDQPGQRIGTEGPCSLCYAARATRPCRLTVRTPVFQAGSTGSTPVRAATRCRQSPCRSVSGTWSRHGGPMARSLSAWLNRDARPCGVGSERDTRRSRARSSVSTTRGPSCGPQARRNSRQNGWNGIPGSHQVDRFDLIKPGQDQEPDERYRLDCPSRGSISLRLGRRFGSQGVSTEGRLSPPSAKAW